MELVDSLLVLRDLLSDLTKYWWRWQKLGASLLGWGDLLDIVDSMLEAAERPPFAVAFPVEVALLRYFVGRSCR